MSSFFTALSYSVPQSNPTCLGVTGTYNVIGNSMLPSTSLNTCDALKSANGDYIYTMQSDGNSVVYFTKYGQNGVAFWETGTAGKGPGPWTMRYQPDGNFALYNSKNEPQWSAKIEKSTARNVTMKDDGNLVAYGTENENSPVWASRKV